MIIKGEQVFRKVLEFLKKIVSFIEKHTGSTRPFGFVTRLAWYIGISFSSLAAYMIVLRDKLTLIFSILTWLEGSVIVLLLLMPITFLAFKIKSLQEELIKANKLFVIYRNNSFNWLLLADENAKCDQGLFDIFLLYLTSRETSFESLEKSLNTAASITNQNIADLIKSAVKLFDELTGAECAICIKLISYENFDQKNLIVETHQRDIRSKNKRDHYDGGKNTVMSNTADRHIFMEHNGKYHNLWYANDSLMTEMANGKYHNERHEWWKHYTATIVCGIADLRPDQKIPWRGLLCVDNMSGGLDNELCKSYVLELSKRLSIMIYREKTMAEHLSNRKTTC